MAALLSTTIAVVMLFCMQALANMLIIEFKLKAWLAYLLTLAYIVLLILLNRSSLPL